jgi:hypothetical protein
LAPALRGSVTEGLHRPHLTGASVWLASCRTGDARIEQMLTTRMRKPRVRAPFLKGQ